MTAPTLPDMAKAEIAIVEMTNAYRKRHSLAELKPDTKLTNAARAYAAYLARTGKFAHDADGRQHAERAATAGYRYCYVAENLALQQSSQGFETRELARSMVEGWVNSEGHRRAMLAPHATDTAVAIARGPDKDPKYIAVQLFGRPRELAYRFQISNSSGMPVRYGFGGQQHELKPGQGVGHTACEPADVAFEGAVRGTAGPAPRYEARDGVLFVLEKTAGGYRVEVRQQERIR